MKSFRMFYLRDFVFILSCIFRQAISTVHHQRNVLRVAEDLSCVEAAEDLLRQCGLLLYPLQGEVFRHGEGAHDARWDHLLVLWNRP